jgi:2-polyprenyl-3-methyl-5-hydroxy-6-metoxy-1,4-benzoquinol methylase
MPQIIACPFCNGYNFKPYAARIYENAPHHLRCICKTCGLIFANPQATPQELETFYQQYFDRGNFTGWKDEVRQWKICVDTDPNYIMKEIDRIAIRIQNAVDKYCPTKDPNSVYMLEAGAGLGGLAYLAKNHGYNVSVTELDADAIIFLKDEMGIQNSFLGDLSNIPLPESFYDIVVIHHVLEHVNDLFGTLNTINKILKPDGVIFIGVPNLKSIGYKLNRAISFMTFNVPDIVEGIEHTFGFTPKTLDNCLKKSGFETKSIKAYGKGDGIKKLISNFSDSPQKALIRVFENIFHTKMECVAIKVRNSH